jgi:hypothetical protein
MIKNGFSEFEGNNGAESASSVASSVWQKANFRDVLPGKRCVSGQSAALRLARLRTPRLAALVAAADRRAHVQVALPQPSGSHFQTRWFLRLLLHRRRHKTVPEPFSYPARRFLHARDLRCLHSPHRRCTCPVRGHRPRGWTSDLFFSQPRPEFRGSPVESRLRPWGRSNQSGVL